LIVLLYPIYLYSSYLITPHIYPRWHSCQQLPAWVGRSVASVTVCLFVRTLTR